jgi:hypothetical protein
VGFTWAKPVSPVMLGVVVNKALAWCDLALIVAVGVVVVVLLLILWPAPPPVISRPA